MQRVSTLRWLNRLLRRSGVVAVLLAGAAVSDGQARDDAACGRQQERTVAGARITTQNCPIYVPKRLGRVPVVKFGVKRREVGRILRGGSVNWFICQLRGPSQRVSEGRFFNTWWALTLSDDGHRGWVNEVYFKGGRNDERDAGLRSCTRADVRWGRAGRPG